MLPQPPRILVAHVDTQSYCILKVIVVIYVRFYMLNVQAVPAFNQLDRALVCSLGTPLDRALGPTSQD